MIRGELAEATLDWFFSRTYSIEEVATPKRWYDADPPDPNDYRVWGQRRDIDRVFTRKRDGWAST
ncbi:MAG: hypothetical protein HRF48_14595, partial [Chloroflexota bacterium]